MSVQHRQQEIECWVCLVQFKMRFTVLRNGWAEEILVGTWRSTWSAQSEPHRPLSDWMRWHCASRPEVNMAVTFTTIKHPFPETWTFLWLQFRPVSLIKSLYSPDQNDGKIFCNAYKKSHKAELISQNFFGDSPFEIDSFPLPTMGERLGTET